MARPDFNTGTKVLLAAGTALFAIGLFDFIFKGHHSCDIAYAVGFALIVGGTFKNGGLGKSSAGGDPPVSNLATYAAGIGWLLVLGSKLARYLQ